MPKIVEQDSTNDLSHRGSQVQILLATPPSSMFLCVLILIWKVGTYGIWGIFVVLNKYFLFQVVNVVTFVVMVVSSRLKR